MDLFWPTDKQCDCYDGLALRIWKLILSWRVRKEASSHIQIRRNTLDTPTLSADHLLLDGAGGQGADDPLQVQSLEGDQHQAGVVAQVDGALWIHDMMGRPGAHVLLEPSGGSLIHPARKQSWSFF